MLGNSKRGKKFDAASAVHVGRNAGRVLDQPSVWKAAIGAVEPVQYGEDYTRVELEYHAGAERESAPAAVPYRLPAES